MSHIHEEKEKIVCRNLRSVVWNVRSVIRNGRSVIWNVRSVIWNGDFDKGEETIHSLPPNIPLTFSQTFLNVSIF